MIVYPGVHHYYLFPTCEENCAIKLPNAYILKHAGFTHSFFYGSVLWNKKKQNPNRVTLLQATCPSAGRPSRLYFLKTAGGIKSKFTQKLRSILLRSSKNIQTPNSMQ